jgi:hypothetical protein
VCKRSDYAFLTISVIEMQIRPYLSCPTVYVPDYFIPVSMSMVGKKKSKFKELFNY